MFSSIHRIKNHSNRSKGFYGSGTTASICNPGHRLRKYGFRILAALLLVTSLPATISGRTADDSVLTGIQIPALNFTPPPVDSRQLTPYATLYRLHNDTLPVVRLRIVIEGGEDLESLEQAGNLGAMSALLATTGAGKLSAEEMANRLAMLGASISTSVSNQSWEISLSAMKEDFPAAMDLLVMILTDPTFDESSLATVKNQMISSIRSRTDEPDTVGFLKLNSILFPDTRRGYAIQESDVARISLESVRKTLQGRLKNARYHIALDGDFQGLAVEKKLVDLLRKLPVPAKPLTVLPDNGFQPEAGKNPYRGKIVHVTGDYAQSLLIVASPTVAHNANEFYTMQLGNHILGGGSFTSRLMQEIRVKRGLAYYAYSFNRSRASDGYLAAVSATRSDRAGETLSLMLQMIEGMKKNVDSDDVAQARTAILNSLVFLYDNPSEILADHIRFQIDQMPPNYLNQFPEKIKAVTPEDIKKSFQKYLDRDDLYIVVVGPKSLASELRNIAPVIQMEASP